MAERTLVEWLQAFGGLVHDDLLLASTGVSGTSERGIFSKADIQEGCELLSIPLRLCLCVDRVRAASVNSVISWDRGCISRIELSLTAQYMLRWPYAGSCVLAPRRRYHAVAVSGHSSITPARDWQGACQSSMSHTFECSLHFRCACRS